MKPNYISSATRIKALSTGGIGGGDGVSAKYTATANFFTTYGDMINDYSKLKFLFNNLINVDISNASKKYINAEFDDFNRLLMNTENLVNVTIDISQNNFLPSDYLVSQKDILDGLGQLPNRSNKYDENLIDNFKKTTFDNINVLQQAGSEYIKIKNLQNENEELKSYRDILENRELLIQYLDELQETSVFFSTETTLDTQIEIKEWYKIYLERFGPPGDGVFDTEKLANIIQELINDPNSDITEDTLIY